MICRFSKRAVKAVASVAVASIVSLVAMSTASAEWGEGVRGGPFVVHPGVSLSVGFDSNLYHESAGSTHAIHRAPEGIVEPRLGIRTAEGGSWNFQADAAVGWRQFFSDDDRIRRQSGLSASLDGSLRWNEEGAFSLQFSDEFARTNEIPNYVTSEPLNRIFNRAGVMAGLHPGGRVIESYGSYDFSLYRHSRLQGLDRNTHHFGWNTHWAFLPRTALTAEVDHRRIRYEREFTGEVIDGRIRNSDSNPVRLLGGIEGLITPRISLGLRGGYGWARYEVGPDHQGALARVEASYQFGSLEFDNRLRAGYRYGFRDASIGNFYRTHRGIAGYEQGFFGNRFRLDVEGSLQTRDYAELDVDAATVDLGTADLPEGNLNDLLIGGDVRASYEIRNGWEVGLSYRFRSNFTDDRIEIEYVGDPDEETLMRDYQRHHLLLSTELTY